MIIDRLLDWFNKRRSPVKIIDSVLAHDFSLCFSGPSGQRVLQYLLDTIYCEVYEGSDPVLLAAHNGRRSVIHEILFNIDVGDHPERYRTQIETIETMEGVKHG